MLGLGNSLMSSGIVKTLHFSYQSDFTSDDNNWHKSESLHAGTPTITANQGTGDASDGTGWLKIVYGADQPFPNSGGIARDMITSPDLFRSNDFIVVSFKIKLIHNGVDDHWGGTDDVGLHMTPGNFTLLENISLNTTHTIESSFNLNFNTADRKLRLKFNSNGDRPFAGATWYLKDFSIQVFR